METAFFKTPLGIAKIIGDENGICNLTILDDALVSETIPLILQEAVFQINNYFSEGKQNFTFKINPIGTVFQNKVWKSLQEIPYGKTCSYLELSKKIGDVKAIRAVANANAKNPLWIIIPCHRIIGSDGSLTGYAGGLWRKKWLLEHENPIKQQLLF